MLPSIKRPSNGPVVHTETRNRSFRLTYLELKKLGIKNNKFFLALYDESLKFVNPHAKDLTEEQKSRILIEIKKNPWYFYREVARIKVAGSLKGISFTLHRANLAQLWCLHKNISCVLVLPRQNFKTISACSFYEYLYLFGTESSEFLIMNKKLIDARKNLKRIKDMIELLPRWMVIKHKDDVNNITSAFSGITKNTLTVVPSGKDEEHADGLGRGLTSPIHWNDEHAFEKYNKIKYFAAGPSYSQASLDARAMGKYYSRHITTTPNNIDVEEGIFTKSIINNSAEFGEFLYDLSKEELHNYIRKNSSNDYLYITYTYKQLRRSQEWYEEQCRILEGNLKAIRREIHCEWASSSDLSPFTEEEIVELEYYQREPLQEELFFNETYPLKIYAPIDLDVEYILTMDVSGGLGQDSTTIIVNHPDTLETVALIKSNKMDLEDAKGVAKELLDSLPNSFIIIERNSYGLSVIQHLLKIKEYSNRVFYTEKREEKNTSSMKAKKAPLKRVFGVDTTSASRKLIIEALYLMVRDSPEVFVSKDIINEIKTLINNKGKIEHMPGEHDDCVLAKAFLKYVHIHFLHIVRRFRISVRDRNIEGFKRISRYNNVLFDERSSNFQDPLADMRHQYSENNNVNEFGDSIRKIRGENQQQRNFDFISALNSDKTRLSPQPQIGNRNISLSDYLPVTSEEKSAGD